MTDQDIKNYFGAAVIYKWDGTLDELRLHQEASASSYSVIRVAEVIYFAPTLAAPHPKASVWFDNTQGAN